MISNRFDPGGVVDLPLIYFDIQHFSNVIKHLEFQFYFFGEVNGNAKVIMYFYMDGSEGRGLTVFVIYFIESNWHGIWINVR